MIILYILIAFVLPIPLAVGVQVMSMQGIIPALSDMQTALLINIIVYIILPIVAIILMRQKLSEDIKKMGPLIGWVIPMILMVYGTSILGGILMQYLDHTQTTNNQEMIERLREINGYFTTYMAVVAAPITEESVFRASMLSNRRGFFAFIFLLLSSALFSLAHVQSFSIGAFIVYVLIALVLGAIYLKYRNLVLNILVHAGYNALALALATFMQDYV